MSVTTLSGTFLAAEASLDAFAAIVLSPEERAPARARQHLGSSLVRFEKLLGHMKLNGDRAHARGISQGSMSQQLS